MLALRGVVCMKTVDLVGAVVIEEDPRTVDVLLPSAEPGAPIDNDDDIDDERPAAVCA